MKHILVLGIFFSLPQFTFCQSDSSMETLPYRNIPEAPDTYTACTVAARMLDGLGFRYYWATEALRKEDLAYRLSEDARTLEETLDHVYGLVFMTHSAIKGQVYKRENAQQNFSFEKERKMTLELIKEASAILKANPSDDLSNYMIDFGSSKVSFWNLINGPVEDAVWHVGQIVSLRRAAGNPFNSKVNLFMGTVRE